jgi:hypothetical protein
VDPGDEPRLLDIRAAGPRWSRIVGQHVGQAPTQSASRA